MDTREKIINFATELKQSDPPIAAILFVIAGSMCDGSIMDLMTLVIEHAKYQVSANAELVRRRK